MTITSSSRSPRTGSTTTSPTDVALRVGGAVLALAVAAIHVKDQGGIPGDKSPTYVGIGYYVLEIVAVLTALALLARRGRSAAGAWLLAAGVALGPLVGYALSRGPGLPDYTDDRGNWTEPLGVISVVVEVVLLVLALVALSAGRRSRG